MKLVTYCRFTTSDKKECQRCLDIIKENGIKVNKINDDDFMYIKWENEIFKFDRFDEKLIKNVEYIFETNPYKHCPGMNYEGFVIIEEIDDRFTDKKYWNITKDKKGNETLHINTNQIIEDLWNKK